MELFFKWIKQHLRIKQFYRTSENAVKTQIWTVVSVYVLVVIVKKRLRLDASLYALMQLISVTIFEKVSIQTTFSSEMSKCHTVTENNQLSRPLRQKIGTGCCTMPVNRSPIGAVWTFFG